MVSPTWKCFPRYLYFEGDGGNSGLMRTYSILHVRRPARPGAHGSRLWNGFVQAVT